MVGGKGAAPGRKCKTIRRLVVDCPHVQPERKPAWAILKGVQLILADHPAHVRVFCEYQTLSKGYIVLYLFVQYVSGGILRGCGRQWLGAVCNFTAYIAIGLPMAAVFMFVLKLGAIGMGVFTIHFVPSCVHSLESYSLSACLLTDHKSSLLGDSCWCVLHHHSNLWSVTRFTSTVMKIVSWILTKTLCNLQFQPEFYTWTEPWFKSSLAWENFSGL